MKSIIILSVLIAICNAVTYKEFTMCLIRNKCLSYNCENVNDLECAKAILKFGECNRTAEKCKTFYK